MVGIQLSNPSLLDSLHFLSCSGKSDKPSKRLYLTDGAHEAFPGLGIYFLRVSNKPITPANIAQELNFGVLESSSGNLLEAVESLLKNVYLPALREQSNWGKLSDDASGHSAKELFLGKLDSFVGVLANARASIADAARISPCSNPSILAISSPLEAIAAASNPELVAGAESCALTWCKEIEQVSGLFLPTRASLHQPFWCTVSLHVDPDRIGTDAQRS